MSRLSLNSPKTPMEGDEPVNGDKVMQKCIFF